MKKIKDDDILYNELMVIDSDANEHTCDVIGISKDGKLLFIKEREFRSCNAYCLRKEFYLIDKDEYLKHIGIAAKTNYLQRCISNGTIDFEACYNGSYFRIGSSICDIKNHKECDAVRITHKDKESGAIYLQQEFSPSEIEELLI